MFIINEKCYDRKNDTLFGPRETVEVAMLAGNGFFYHCYFDVPSSNTINSNSRVGHVAFHVDPLVHNRGRSNVKN